MTLDIHAQDVAHSWWIPKLGGKFDAIPGYTNYTWFKIPASSAGTVFTGPVRRALRAQPREHDRRRSRAVTPAAVRGVARPTSKAEIKAADDAAAQQRKQLDAGQHPCRTP